MDSHDFDIYLEFVSTLYSTTSRSEYFMWEDAIVELYWIGELPLSQLVNLAKKTFSCAVSFWLRALLGELGNGDDYFISWYEMKEVLRHRFAPALESKQHILSSGGCFSFHASEISGSKEFEKNASPKNPIEIVSASDTIATTSIVETALITTIAMVVDPSIDSFIEPSLDVNMASGLSLMSHEVHRDGTISAMKEQRSNIFQSECKIQDKVCKLIIDGGSFTNAISLDMVHALSLSTWRLPTPCYMQWINQSGTLKITHNARVKFSVGDYVNSVVCVVAPLTACHLLLGRPWQFDLDATHGGRSNTYSFVHKGIEHVLKPMKENDIKAGVFPTVKRKREVSKTTPKPRMALLQGEENDVTRITPNLKANSPVDFRQTINAFVVLFGSSPIHVNQSHMVDIKGLIIGCKREKKK
uniref:Retrotransposon gag domain-containing protein n=1 Tax=Leersia perrieri TaxID=77586 RepID=A0A0D9XYF2_9ORYZ